MNSQLWMAILAGASIVFSAGALVNMMHNLSKDLEKLADETSEKLERLRTDMKNDIEELEKRNAELEKEVVRLQERSQDRKAGT